MHAAIALAFKCPEFIVDTDEALDLADGVIGVASQYDLNIDPRTVAWTNLFGVILMIYGGRIFKVAKRMKKEAATHAANRDAPVG